jgi:tetratricopeptide (TPR) repeat protein
MLVPVVLVLLFVLGIYVASDSNLSTKKEYAGHMSTARSFAKQGIAVDAIASYKEALAMQASVPLYLELGRYYIECEHYAQAQDLGEEMLAKYPKNPEGYKFLMELYNNNGDYAECFKAYDKLVKKRLPTDSVQELYKEIYDTYELEYTDEYEEVSLFGGGYCAVKLEGKWGYLSEKGKKAVSCIYTEAGVFSEGLAPVLDTQNKAYFIDTSGNRKKNITADSVKKAGSIERDVFTGFNGQTWGFYNAESELIAGEYDGISTYANGVAAVKQNGMWSIVNGQGKQIGSGCYDKILSDEKGIIYRNERYFVKEGEKVYMLDASGNKVGTTGFNDARIFGGIGEGAYAAVKAGELWGFIDASGNYFIEPEYENARSFSNGYAAVQKDGLWGFINLKNELAIVNKFDEAMDFNSKGYVFVNERRSWKLLALYRLNHK